MEQIKVLLFEVGSTGGAGARMKGLLETAGSNMFELKHEIASDVPLAGHHLRRILSTFSPQVSLLISGFQGGIDLTELFRAFCAGARPCPVIAVADTEEAQGMGQALAQGACDFLLPPFPAMELLLRIGRLVEETKQEAGSIRAMKESLGLEQIVGESPALLGEMRKIPGAAQCDASILIEGETGTGKEIFAQALHESSRRSRGPFIAVNCGTIQVDLAENELFGHELGAFTGASSSAPGLIYQADGGTLFLDEVDSLPMLVQVKLLRFLEDKEYRPLGSPKLRKVNVRIIAATGADLGEAVRAGRFRSDLLYRLDVIKITLPPLRQRAGDIPLLACHFAEKYSAEFEMPRKQFTPAAMQKLLFYGWPGNVRELGNVIERAVALSRREKIHWDDVELPTPKAEPSWETFQVKKAKLVELFTREQVAAALAEHGSVTNAARAVGKHRRAFLELMRKYGIRSPEN